VLARGYSIVCDDAGRIVTDSTTLEPSQRIAVSFHRGRALARVEQCGDGIERAAPANSQ
jgi:exonuclease VII large subunit